MKSEIEKKLSIFYNVKRFFFLILWYGKIGNFFLQKKAKLVEFKLDKHNFPNMYQLFVGKKKKKSVRKKPLLVLGLCNGT